MTDIEFDKRPLMDRIEYTLSNPVQSLEHHVHDLEELLREVADAHPAPSEPVSDLVRLDGVTMTPAAAANRLAEAASALTAAEARAAEAEKERDEATAWRIRLQHALMFWMPGVREATDTGLDRSAGDDAYLLIDFRGDAPSACWGDDILARAEAAEAKIAELEQRSLAEGWRPIETAPKDGTVIWAIFYPDIYPRIRPLREDLERWNGRQVSLTHPGVCELDGRVWDHGWNIAAPVGSGGFPDEWIAGWMPLPQPPEAK